jgi:Uma2 family endonuclease
MATQARVMTAEELAQLPDDGWHYELVKGELRKMPPPGYDHGAIGMNLGGALHQYVKTNQLGRVFSSETGFLVETNPDTVLAPDVAFVRVERAPAFGQVKGYWAGAPDLVGEVISPGDSKKEVAGKVAAWLAAGVRLVLVVNPRDQTVSVHRPGTAAEVLTTRDTLDGGDVVPGWTLPVRELFA